MGSLDLSFIDLLLEDGEMIVYGSDKYDGEYKKEDPKEYDEIGKKTKKEKFKMWLDNIIKVIKNIMSAVINWIKDVASIFKVQRMKDTAFVMEFATKFASIKSTDKGVLQFNKAEDVISPYQIRSVFERSKSVINYIKSIFDISDLVDGNMNEDQKETIINNIKENDMKSKMFLTLLAAYGDKSAKVDKELYKDKKETEQMKVEEFRDRFIKNIFVEKTPVVNVTQIVTLTNGSNSAYDIAYSGIKQIGDTLNNQLKSNISALDRMSNRKDVWESDLKVANVFIKMNKSCIEAISTLPQIFKTALSKSMSQYKGYCIKYLKNHGVYMTLGEDKEKIKESVDVSKTYLSDLNYI